MDEDIFDFDSEYQDILHDEIDQPGELKNS
jgi:hypothetical protein